MGKKTRLLAQQEAIPSCPTRGLVFLLNKTPRPLLGQEDMSFWWAQDLYGVPQGSTQGPTQGSTGLHTASRKIYGVPQGSTQGL